MRITEDEYKAVQDAPDPQPLSGGAWPAAQSSYGPSYQSDGLGHYSTDGGATWMNDSGGQYQEPPSTGLGNYNLGFGGSPVTSYATPDANSDGLNDTTGWAMGVEQDQNSPTGFSYNGAPVSSNGAPYTPPTYQQPGGDWYNYDNQPALNNAPFQDPGYESPWNPSYMKDQGGGGFLGGLKDFIQPGINAVVNNPVVGAGMIAGNAANDFIDNLTGTSRQQRINDQLSGNALVHDVSGGRVDLNQLPYGAGYVTDAALAPASYLGWGATGGAGATAWEGVKQIGSGALGNAAAKFGASDTASNIPVYGDQPAWLRGLEAGAVGGVAGYGAIGGLGNAAKEAGGFGPLLKSEVGSTPPLGKGGTGEGFDAARKKIWADVEQGIYHPEEGPLSTEEILKGAQPKSLYRAVSDAELANAEQTGAFKHWAGSDLYVTPDPDRLAGGAYGAKGSGAIIETDPLPVHGVGSRTVDLQELGVSEIPMTSVKKIWKWDAAAGDHVLAYERGAGSATDTSLNPIRRQIADALDNELKFRNSGEAEAIKAAKRAQQFAGVDAAQMGATSAETIANIKGGARVGEFFDRTPGLKLSEPDFNAALGDIKNSTQGPETLKAITALDKLQNGQRLQPGEIKTLGKLYGPEIEAKIRATNADRIQTVAELTPEDIAKINRQAEVDGKRVATLEVQSARQHELADNLQKQLNMDPTNQTLKKAVEDARARGIKQAAQADELLAARAEKLTANLPQRAEQGAISSEASRYGTVEEALKHDKALAAQEAAVRKAAEDEWVKGLQNSGDTYESLLPGAIKARQAEIDSRVARWEAKQQRDLGRMQDRALAQQTDRRATAEFKASGQAAVAEVEKMIDKLDVPPAMKDAQKAFVAATIRSNGAFLDAMGDAGPSLIRRAYAAATGEVTDSWTSTLITRTRAAEAGLEQLGMSPDAARTAAKLLQDAEVKRRFGNNVPSWVQDSLDQAKGVTRDPATGKVVESSFSRGSSGSIIESAGNISQEFKNTAFGPMDVGAFGQQMLHGLNTNTVQFLTGLGNRLANLAHGMGVNTDAIGQDLIGKRAQYALDNLSHSGATGVVDASNGTLLRLVPGLKTLDKKVLTPWINTLTDIQFKHALGWFRDVTYEGNLVLAKMAGADIQDPVVRANAAKWANAASGAGTLAQRANRANLEKATLLSASMTRAQGQQIGLVARGLTAGTRVDRVMAAATIISTVGTTLGIGKLLNDWIGTDDFEFDPNKPGFGNIRLGDGTLINLFSQTQVPKTLIQSIEILKKDGFTKDDLNQLGTVWGKLALGRSSPALRIIEGASGFGYEPGRGYRFGDYMEGKPWYEKAAQNLPIPPLAQSISERAKTGSLKDAILTPQTAFDLTGVSSYSESPYAKRARELGPNPTEKQLFDYEQKNGRIYSSDPKIAEQQHKADQIHQDQLDRQNARDTELTTGTWSPDKATQWREQRKQDNLYFAGRFDQLYSGVNFKDKNVTDVDRYYKAIADNTDRVTGDINWDAVDAATKGLNQEYIKANTNLRDTSIEKSYRTALDTIESSGYFNRQEQTWAKVQKYSDEAKAYPDYYAWKDAKLEEQTQKFMDRYGYDKLYAASMAEKAVNASAPEKIYDGYSKQWKADWVMQNPAAAYQAWTWGYYTPTDDMKAFLNKWAKGK